MIVSDTNVVSEAMKPEPHPAVPGLAERSSSRNTLPVQRDTRRACCLALQHSPPVSARICWHRPLMV